MRRVLLVAAVALAVTFNGSVFASENTSESQELLISLADTPPIDSKIAEQVLQYMANELEYNYQTISQQYQSGSLTIDTDGDIYYVTILQEDGIVVSIEIDF